jgi:hypothetical protein
LRYIYLHLEEAIRARNWGQVRQIAEESQDAQKALREIAIVLLADKQGRLAESVEMIANTCLQKSEDLTIPSFHFHPVSNDISSLEAAFSNCSIAVIQPEASRWEVLQQAGSQEELDTSDEDSYDEDSDVDEAGPSQAR